MLLVLGLALAAAACGSTTGSSRGTQPTATPRSTLTTTQMPSVVWRLVTSPNPTHPAESILAATTALSPMDAWAVGGSYIESDGAQSLIERWDGSAWHIIP
ncbi:MAG: hypothetical protein ACXVDA_20870, partial [Ktedonobacterales bacterium]